MVSLDAAGGGPVTGPVFSPAAYVHQRGGRDSHGVRKGAGYGEEEREKGSVRVLWDAAFSAICEG